mmetsp:Transcript_55685/g.144809  ORF Transcript_55685/g.144809 Transcript_55685/m.144809 type:complete len:238 (-) Transcript_55685:121-834(-)
MLAHSMRAAWCSGTRSFLARSTSASTVSASALASPTSGTASCPSAVLAASAAAASFSRHARACLSAFWAWRSSSSWSISRARRFASCMFRSVASAPKVWTASLISASMASAHRFAISGITPLLLPARSSSCSNSSRHRSTHRLQARSAMTCSALNRSSCPFSFMTPTASLIIRLIASMSSSGSSRMAHSRVAGAHQSTASLARERNLSRISCFAGSPKDAAKASNWLLLASAGSPSL